MASYSKTNDVPRDPSAIEERDYGFRSILSTVIVLLIIVAAFGLYFIYVGLAPTRPTILSPVTENAPAPTAAPALQPPAHANP